MEPDFIAGASKNEQTGSASGLLLCDLGVLSIVGTTEVKSVKYFVND